MPSDYRRNGGTQMATFSVFEEIAAILRGSRTTSEPARVRPENVRETGNLACRILNRPRKTMDQGSGRPTPDIRTSPTAASTEPMLQTPSTACDVISERKAPGGPAPTTMETAMSLVNFALPVRIERVRVYRFH